MTWSWWQIAAVLGLLGVSITIFVAAIASPNATRPRHRRTDLELALLALEDDAVVIVGLRMDDPAQVEIIQHDSASGTLGQESAS